ncbi:GNAT family N-acetyltransferase [Treponema zioleckii]|uniref:GNAT family N-acetyltransferase n=1 Tax=Treponema zioleckii TaxID=331680 RepID=UPI00168B9D33|nr:GNAT family N-acetyltransferase [Treponema zioleckii]
MENEIKIRLAKADDAESLLKIYSYYVENTAITFEYKTPTVEEFKKRIQKTLQKYPYYVAESCKDDRNMILGYAYAGDFKAREAYNWSIETSIYVHKDFKKNGIGSLLLEKLESTLAEMNITNANACIAKAEVEDEHLTNASINFHARMGYKMVGEFHKCAYKFGRWYNMVWMEKFIGEHSENQKSVNFKNFATF